MSVDKARVKQLFLQRLQEVSERAMTAHRDMTLAMKFYLANGLDAENSFNDQDVSGQFGHLAPEDVGTTVTNLQTISTAMTDEIVASLVKMVGKPV